MMTSRGIYAPPCGGIGGGTVGRGHTGEFCRMQMIPGMYSYDTVWANAFHVCVRDASDKILFTSVLSSDRYRTKKDKNVLREWQYNLKDENIECRALYPRAWFRYKIPELGLVLTCRQTSPFIPGNYKDSSFPSCLFEWNVENTSSTEYNVTIGLTWKSGWLNKHKRNDITVNAVKSDKTETQTFSTIEQTTKNGMKLTYGVAVNGGKCQQSTFKVNGNGRDFIEAFTGEGKNKEQGSTSNFGVAVSASALVKPDSSNETIRFGLCWHMPVIQFMGASKTHRRYYTRFIHQEDPHEAVRFLLEQTFERSSKWQELINDWQSSIVEDSALPNWFKSAAFNEMYYIADGGSQWLEIEEKEILKESPDPRKRFGRFLYLESHEYRLYNTYDVHFYASAALGSLFPGLQLSLQTDFVAATAGRDPRRVTSLYDGTKMELNPENSVPHDLGDPGDAPLENVNGYRIHDVSNWKDLNLKLVISVWRDIVWARKSEDLDVKEAGSSLAQHAWPVCINVMEVAEKWDKDGDGLIENDGLPDQTYDSWVMTGASSYCNSLWIAALKCMAAFAAERSDEEQEERFQKMADKALKSFEEKMWAGSFYRFDSSPHGADVVMTDQLCGLWYLHQIGFLDDEAQDGNDSMSCASARDDFFGIVRSPKGDIAQIIGTPTSTPRATTPLVPSAKKPTFVFDPDRVQTALTTIMEGNVRGVKNGIAANGWTNNHVDKAHVQSEESWTGVVYALAALLVYEGRVEEGLEVAEGIYRAVYERCGLGFETPEALYPLTPKYRAIGYMRPLSIWSIVDALKKRK